MSYASCVKWDSMHHMELITRIEHKFDIMMDIDDIIDMSSFAKAQEILREKYDIDFNT